MQIFSYSNTRILFLVRGAPGLGRVMPSLAMWETIKASGGKALFLTNRVGYKFLSILKEDVLDIGATESIFLNPLDPPFEKAINSIEKFEPDLIVVDGEPVVLPYLRRFERSIIFIANPHDLFGPINHFRKIHKVFVEHADLIVVPSLDFLTHKYETKEGFLITPPFVRTTKQVVNRTKLNSPPHVIVSLGGGVVGGGHDFRLLTQELFNRLVEALYYLFQVNELSRVSLIPGEGIEILSDLNFPPEFKLYTQPIDLLSLLSEADLTITRAGRNTIAELAYYGYPGMVIPLNMDPLRGSEQHSNAVHARTFPNIYVFIPEDLSFRNIFTAIRNAITETAKTNIKPFTPGNFILAQILFGEHSAFTNIITPDKV